MGAIYVFHVIVIVCDQQDRTDDHTEFKRFILISCSEVSDEVLDEVCAILLSEFNLPMIL
jgi:hypothetical protein